MTDHELIAEWHTMSGDNDDTPRAAELADEMALRDIDFWQRIEVGRASVIPIDQLEQLIDQSRAQGREPLLVRVLPEKLASLEADGDARQVLGRGTIFGIPYEPHPIASGMAVVLVCEDELPDQPQE